MTAGRFDTGWVAAVLRLLPQALHARLDAWASRTAQARGARRRARMLALRAVRRQQAAGH